MPVSVVRATRVAVRHADHDAGRWGAGNQPRRNCLFATCDLARLRPAGGRRANWGNRLVPGRDRIVMQPGAYGARTRHATRVTRNVGPAR